MLAAAAVLVVVVVPTMTEEFSGGTTSLLVPCRGALLSLRPGTRPSEAQLARVAATSSGCSCLLVVAGRGGSPRWSPSPGLLPPRRLDLSVPLLAVTVAVAVVEEAMGRGGGPVSVAHG
jgi:hypothetical protein